MLANKYLVLPVLVIIGGQLGSCDDTDAPAICDTEQEYKIVSSKWVGEELVKVKRMNYRTEKCERLRKYMHREVIPIGSKPNAENGGLKGKEKPRRTRRRRVERWAKRSTKNLLDSKAKSRAAIANHTSKRHKREIRSRRKKEEVNYEQEGEYIRCDFKKYPCRYTDDKKEHPWPEHVQKDAHEICYNKDKEVKYVNGLFDRRTVPIYVDKQGTQVKTENRLTTKLYCIVCDIWDHKKLFPTKEQEVAWFQVVRDYKKIEDGWNRRTDGEQKSNYLEKVLKSFGRKYTYTKKLGNRFLKAHKNFEWNPDKALLEITEFKEDTEGLYYCVSQADAERSEDNPEETIKYARRIYQIDGYVTWEEPEQIPKGQKIVRSDESKYKLKKWDTDSSKVPFRWGDDPDSKKYFSIMNLEIYTHWRSWGPCPAGVACENLTALLNEMRKTKESAVFHGKQKRIGRCVVRAQPSNDDMAYPTVLTYYGKRPIAFRKFMPCHSSLFKHFPGLKAFYGRPDEFESQNCSTKCEDPPEEVVAASEGVIGVGLEKPPALSVTFDKTYGPGTKFTMQCPQSSAADQIVWRRKKSILTRQHLFKKYQRRVFITQDGRLAITETETLDSGTYRCEVSGVTRGTWNIEIREGPPVGYLSAWTDDFTMWLKLLLIFHLVSFCCFLLCLWNKYTYETLRRRRREALGATSAKGTSTKAALSKDRKKAMQKMKNLDVERRRQRTAEVGSKALERILD